MSTVGTTYQRYLIPVPIQLQHEIIDISSQIHEARRVAEESSHLDVVSRVQVDSNNRRLVVVVGRYYRTKYVSYRSVIKRSEWNGYTSQKNV